MCHILSEVSQVLYQRALHEHLSPHILNSVKGGLERPAYVSHYNRLRLYPSLPLHTPAESLPLTTSHHLAPQA